MLAHRDARKTITTFQHQLEETSKSQEKQVQSTITLQSAPKKAHKKTVLTCSLISNELEQKQLK